MTEKKELPEWLEKARLTPKRTRKQRKELFPHGFTDCTDCEEFIRKSQQQADYDAFLKQRLDRPELREKMAEDLNWYGGSHPYIDWHVVGNEDIKECRKAQADQILALMPDVEEAKRLVVREKNEEINKQEIYWREAIDGVTSELRKRLTEMAEKLDDREADLIEAKREERERVFKEIENKMFSQPIDYDGKFGLDLSTNRYQSYEKWQVLKHKE